MSALTVGSLFSGIGGLDLGLERAGMEVRWQAENDHYCSKLLKRHWPQVPNLGDVCHVRWEEAEAVDLVAGGFPCQDVSDAGGRAGIDGERSGLWSEFARCIRALRPRYVLVENTPGLLVRGMGRVVGDLAGLGYDAEWDCIPAAAVGARHLRARIWILAYPRGERDAQEDRIFAGRTKPRVRACWLAEPAVGRVADGLPVGLVRDPLRALGNSVVPQISEFIGRQLLDALEPAA